MTGEEPRSCGSPTGAGAARAVAMAPGVIAHVPNEGPRFIPIAAGMLSCGIAEVAIRVRKAVRTAIFGELREEADESVQDDEVNDFRLLFRERDLEDEWCSAAFLKAMGAGHPCVIRLIFRLLGGKGGFGSLLRGQKGRGKKTSNMDAMRDLSGRRLRHSKAVERIKEWMEMQKREDELVSALSSEGPELPKPTPKAESLDPEFLRRLKKAAAERPALVSQGLRKDRLQSEAMAGAMGDRPKRMRQGSSASDSREAAAAADRFNALIMLEGLSSPEEDQDVEGAPLQRVDDQDLEGEPLQNTDDLKLGSILRVLQDPAAVTAAGSGTGLSTEVWQEAWEASVGQVVRVVQIDSVNLQVKCRVLDVQDVWFAAAALTAMSDGGGTALPSDTGGHRRDAISSCTGAPASSGASGSRTVGSSSAAAAAACPGPPASGSEAEAPQPSGALAGSRVEAADGTRPPGDALASAAACLPKVGSGSPAGVPASPMGATPAEGCPSVGLVRPEDIEGYASAEELAAKVPADILKLSLQHLGMKCGGKPEERAARLFLLKGKSLAELPKSVFATQPK